jgi:type I restriction enzyme S subunit
MRKGWTETTLGDIAKCAGGTAFPHEFQGGETGTPFVKVSDMNESGNERFLASSNNYVSKEAIKSLGARVWPMGTIVFAKVGAALLTEKRRILVKDTIFDNNIMGLVPKASIESQFLYLFMETVKLGDYVQPGAVPSVNNSIVSEIAINLPPLTEQKRIVDVVSSMDEVIQSTEKAVVDAKKLRSGLLSDLLSGEHEIPASYDSLLGAA